MKARLIGFGVALVLLWSMQWHGCASIPSSPTLCTNVSDCASGLCIGGVCVGQKKTASSPSELFPKPDASNPRPEPTPKPDASPTESIADSAILPDPPIFEAAKESGPEGCRESATRKCYQGPGGTEGVGPCKGGEQKCINGSWTGCLGEVIPKTEVCGNQADDNCNGVLDEGCPCNFKGLAKGVCLNSKKDAKGRCLQPKDFTLNLDKCGDKLDNDCDGTIDDGCQCTSGDLRECGTAVGGCAKGKQTCTKGRWETECKGAGIPQPEICDGKDNNCNGYIDEGCNCNFKGLSKGVCVGSFIDGQGKCIQPSDYAASEKCGDKKDNDCDGAVDDGCPCRYNGNWRGVCGKSKIGSDGTCEKPSTQGSEKCGDKLDNDCDGAVDEGCPCNYNGKNQGVCAKAVTDTRGNCTAPSGYETYERCGDKLDNDCDGNTDKIPPGVDCYWRSDCKINSSSSNDYEVCRKGQAACKSDGNYECRFSSSSSRICSQFPSAIKCRSDRDCNTCSSWIKEKYYCSPSTKVCVRRD